MGAEPLLLCYNWSRKKKQSKGKEERVMQGIHCQIRTRRHLSAEWSSWFDGLMVTNEARGEAVLTGVLADDAALYGVLMKMRDLGLPLLALHRETLQEEEQP